MKLQNSNPQQSVHKTFNKSGKPSRYQIECKENGAYKMKK